MQPWESHDQDVLNLCLWGGRGLLVSAELFPGHQVSRTSFMWYGGQETVSWKRQLLQKLIVFYTVCQKINDDTSGEAVDAWHISKQKSHLAVYLQGNVLS